MDDFAAAVMCRRAYEEHTGTVGDLEYLVEGRHIAIRGTEASKLLSGLGVLDVVRNLRIMPWYDRRTGWAHAGMLKGAQALYEQIKPQTSRCFGVATLFGSEHVHITGHSLGAGVGLLLAHMLESDGMVVDFTGFGTPRCMISRPRGTINAKFYRNGDDIVTQIPRWWMGGYRRLPQRQIGDRAGFEAISDHDIDAYILSLIKRV